MDNDNNTSRKKQHIRKGTLSILASVFFVLIIAGARYVGVSDTVGFILVGMIALASLAAGIYELFCAGRAELSGPEKSQKKYLASKGKYPSLDKAVKSINFALNCGDIWKDVLIKAEELGIGEQELIDDSRGGEVFRDPLSVISVGREYTVYCDNRRIKCYILKNRSARRISSYVKIVGIPSDGEDTAEVRINFVVFETDEASFSMHCEEYFDRFILDAYARSGNIAPGVIEYPDDAAFAG